MKLTCKQTPSDNGRKKGAKLIRRTSVWPLGWTSAAFGKSTKVTEKPPTLIIQSGPIRRSGNRIQTLSDPFVVIGSHHQEGWKFAPFSRLLTLAAGRRQLPANRNAFIYKPHCGLYELIFNTVKAFEPFPHLNTALCQIQISHWRMRRELVLQASGKQ